MTERLHVLGRTTEKGAVILVLGLTALLSVGGMIFLAALGKTAPDSIQLIGTGAVTALATFIQRTDGQPVRRKQDAPTEDYRPKRKTPER